MKKSNLLLLWGLTFAAGLVCGGALTWQWAGNRQPVAVCPAATADLLLAQLEQTALPEDVQEILPDMTPKSSDELPSQLVRSELPEDIVLGGIATPKAEEEKPSGVVLSDEQNTVVVQAKKPAQRVADGTSITMIEAPVSLKRISSLDGYKAFKQVARGSYPAADFAKEEVLVLESQSNLPDKVFEIVGVTPEGDTLKLRYRVNVFGLDKKVNTHSAYKIPKTSQNIVLEQVL